MQRRSFLATSTALVAGASMGTAAAEPHAANRKFALGFAPHPGMFEKLAGPDVVAQIKFAASQGFTAWEDNGLAGRSPEDQVKIRQALEAQGMTMGVFVAYANFTEPIFAVPRPDRQEQVIQQLKASVEVAKRAGVKWMTVVPGTVDQQAQGKGKWNDYGGPRLAPGFQLANVIALLRRCAAVLEPHGLVMVLEPLNWPTDHGGVFLRHSDQAYAICKAVNSPACKILFDIYHQQITEGNLIPNIDRCWDEIGYIQCGDNPGRKEPGTGEIHYRNIFRHLLKKGYKGVIGMEHGNSRPGAEGEKAVIQAYWDVDPGEVPHGDH